jgi:hypothetical protein
MMAFYEDGYATSIQFAFYEMKESGQGYLFAVSHIQEHMQQFFPLKLYDGSDNQWKQTFEVFHG